MLASVSGTEGVAVLLLAGVAQLTGGRDCSVFEVIGNVWRARRSSPRGPE